MLCVNIDEPNCGVFSNCGTEIKAETRSTTYRGEGKKLLSCKNRKENKDTL